jgi:hypothetical protein
VDGDDWAGRAGGDPGSTFKPASNAAKRAKLYQLYVISTELLVGTLQSVSSRIGRSWHGTGQS